MFMLADFSVYVAIIATLGEAGIDAVTINLNINFLAKPEPRDLDRLACGCCAWGGALPWGGSALSDGGARSGGSTRWPPMPCRVRPGPLEVIFYRQPRQI